MRRPATISGIPLPRLSDTFETFDKKRNPSMVAALKRCMAVASGRAWCALLIGEYGTGKTHLAIAALNAWGLGRGIFWKVPDFLDWLRRMTFDRYVEDPAAAYRSDPFLLVLDDLGAENPTDWAHEQLYRLLDARQEWRLPTILTSNAGPEAIDGRIRSRYHEGLVVCHGGDVRRSAAKG